MAVTLDSLGKRYSLLPSEVLLKATTFDLEVLDIALTYERYRQDMASGVTPEYRQEDLLKALDAVKEKK